MLKCFSMYTEDGCAPLKVHDVAVVVVACVHKDDGTRTVDHLRTAQSASGKAHTAPGPQASSPCMMSRYQAAFKAYPDIGHVDNTID